jgi:hypothetical protein
MLNIAYFISAYGFGHAIRSGAVMETIRQVAPDVYFVWIWVLCFNVAM